MSVDIEVWGRANGMALRRDPLCQWGCGIRLRRVVDLREVLAGWLLAPTTLMALVPGL